MTGNSDYFSVGGPSSCCAKTGFSLIELMVALAIMGILAAGGYPMLMEYAQESRLEQEAHLIYEDLSLVRDAAISAGYGSATVNFQYQGGVSGNPLVSYEMVENRGHNIRPVLMDENILSSKRLRKNLASRSVCIIPEFPAAPFNILRFGSHGRMTAPHPVRMSFLVRYLNIDTGKVEPSVGGWRIQVPDADDGRLQIEILP